MGLRAMRPANDGFALVHGPSRWKATAQQAMRPRLVVFTALRIPPAIRTAHASRSAARWMSQTVIMVSAR